MGVGTTTRPLEDRVKYTAAAPIVTNNANKPNARGRLRVNSGIRLPWTGFGVTLDDVPPKSVPQTTHLAAFSLTRVPQVGHIFVELLSLSGVIVFFSKLKFGYYTSIYFAF
jgi:hypothetical protein